MKIGVHHRKGSFSDYWIKYCLDNKLDFVTVDCYSSDIIKQLEGIDGLMWNWDQNDYKAALFAKQFTHALRNLPIKTFPDINTIWHFDDKIAQKYLFESIGVPMIPTHIFYEKNEALKWAKNTNFPKVFKLRSGAGAVNVRLVRNINDARTLIRKAFGKGFRHINRKARFDDALHRFRLKPNANNGVGILKAIGRLLFPTELERMSGKHKGYVYFQDFVPGNDFDTRLYVIGNRCFGTRRYNRKNDFRASGSKIVKNEKELFDPECVRLAFEVAKKLKTQSIACDFIVRNGKFTLVEISYCFPANNLLNHPGYWDSNLNWHAQKIVPQIFMIEDFVSTLRV